MSAFSWLVTETDTRTRTRPGHAAKSGARLARPTPECNLPAAVSPKQNACRCFVTKNAPLVAGRGEAFTLSLSLSLYEEALSLSQSLFRRLQGGRAAA